MQTTINPGESKTKSSRHVFQPIELDWRLIGATLVGTLGLAWILRGAPLVGWDWIHDFVGRLNDAYYPPWVTLILRPLTALAPRTGLAIMQGLALSTLTMLVYVQARQRFPTHRLPGVLGVIFALANPLPWMILWDGQIEGMVLLGILTLPVGAPLLFAKPNIGPWAALRSRKDLVWMIGLFALSLVIWGLWPIYLYDNLVINRTAHPIAMGWMNLHPIIGVLGVILLPFTDRDEWRLMSAGFLLMPYTMPYHLFMILPALGRVQGYRQIAVWLSSFFSIAAAGFVTPAAKASALLLPLTVWVLLAPSLRPREILADPDILLNRAIRTARQTVAWVRRQPRSLPAKTR